MQVGNLWPGDSFHLGYGVQLHCAGTKWNHSAVKRVIVISKLLEVTHHCGLRVIGVEHRVLKIRASAVVSQAIGSILLLRGSGPKSTCEFCQVIPRGALIDRNADCVVVYSQDGELFGPSCLVELFSIGIGNSYGVEELIVLKTEANFFQNCCERRGLVVDF